jgi:dimethylglycine dehydrogenase
MKSHARVVVIGGGVVGVSTLYHLAKLGWTDAVLLERSELTAGSTWHAAGLLPLFNMSYTVGQLHKYSVDLYKRLPAETGQDVSFHVTGNLRLATCRDRMDEYRKYCGTANTIGVPFEIIGPDEVKTLWPLVELGDDRAVPKIVGALYHPDDGHIAPADLTMALRRAARNAGAEIHEHTEVTAASATAGGEWRLTTSRGEIVAEHVVCATGNYARQIGRMFGLNVPAIPVEHQYLVYDESRELRAYREGGGRELAVLRESDQSYYLREERLGWISGLTSPERRRDSPTASRLVWQGPFSGRPRAPAAARRSRAAARAGARELRHQGHRERSDQLHAGRQSADRARRGRCAISGSTRATASASRPRAARAGNSRNGSSRASRHRYARRGPRRFGPYTSRRYVVTKNEETYRNVFTIHYPDEERAMGGPRKRAPSTTG